MKRFLDAVLDSIFRLFADKGARMTMVVSILIYAFLYPQPYTGEVVRDVPIVVIDQDGSTASRELRRRVDNSDQVAVVAHTDGLPAAQEMFNARKVYGVLIIPPDFEQDLLHGRQSPIAAFGDGSYFLLYGAISSAVSSAANSLGAEIRVSRLTALGVDAGTAAALVSPVVITSVPQFNPNGGYASFAVPAAFVLIIQQTLLIGIGIMHAGKPARPGIARVATPTAYILVYTFWVAVTQLLLPVIYGLPQVGHPITLFAIAVPFLMAVTAMGFALVQVIPTREGIIFFLVVQGLPLFFITGVSWPIESVPDPIRWLAMAVPSTSAMSSIIRVDQMGASLSMIIPIVKLQLALAVGYAAIAYALHNWRFPNSS